MNIGQTWPKNYVASAPEKSHIISQYSSGNRGSVDPFRMEKHRFFAKVYFPPRHT